MREREREDREEGLFNYRERVEKMKERLEEIERFVFWLWGERERERLWLKEKGEREVERKKMRGWG